MGSARAAVALLASAALVIAPSAANATASTPALPDDVAAFFAEQAPEVLEASELAGTAGGTAAAGVHEVFAWSEAYLAGEPGEPTASLDEWIAAVERGGEPAGTLTAYRPAPDEPAAFASTSDDAELAQALLGLPAGAQLVLDAPADAWFAIVDGIATPLDEHARADLPGGPAALDELQPTVVDRYAAMRGQTDDAAVGGGAAPAAGAQPWLIGAGIVAAVVGVLAAIGVAVRIRRARHEG